MALSADNIDAVFAHNCLTIFFTDVFLTSRQQIPKNKEKKVRKRAR
jgi:hypothetical protein